MSAQKRSRNERDAQAVQEKEEEKKDRQMWFSDSYVFSHLPLTDAQKKQLLADLGCTNYKVVTNNNAQKVI